MICRTEFCAYCGEEFIHRRGDHRFGVVASDGYEFIHCCSPTCERVFKEEIAEVEREFERQTQDVFEPVD